MKRDDWILLALIVGAALFGYFAPEWIRAYLRVIGG